MPGGLALVSLAACAFFTAFTGASGVTIIALGAILYPALKQDGYPDKFNLGLVTSAGSLGLLFAPSLPLILYGVIAEVSIDYLFLAGILPGMLMLVMLAAGVRAPAAPAVTSGDMSAAWKRFMKDAGTHAPATVFPYERCFRRAAETYELPLVVLLAVARGERYFPDDMQERRYYDPVPRGLEIRIREKLAEIRKR